MTPKVLGTEVSSHTARAPQRAGIEPAITRSHVGRVADCTTRPALRAGGAATYDLIVNNNNNNNNNDNNNDNNNKNDNNDTDTDNNNNNNKNNYNNYNITTMLIAGRAAVRLGRADGRGAVRGGDAAAAAPLRRPPAVRPPRPRRRQRRRAGTGVSNVSPEQPSGLYAGSRIQRFRVRNPLGSYTPGGALAVRP
jgi:hypothetical protein